MFKNIDKFFCNIFFSFSPIPAIFISFIKFNFLNFEIILKLKVELNNSSINNNTSGVADLYEDYSGSMYADLTLGSSYSVSVTLGDLSTGNYPSGAKVFIDFNIDGDFTDLGEDIGIVPYGNNSSAVISFTVPSTAVLGATRMRVVSQYRTDQNSNLIGPCDFATGFNAPWFGATEDYSVVLSNATVGSVSCDSTAVLDLTIN